MNRTLSCLATLAALVLLLPASLAATTGLEGIMPHYEQIRRALAADTLEGVEEPAARLARELTALQEGLTADRAGVPAEKLEVVSTLLPEAEEAARHLEMATELDAARDAFYALSKPLVRWREIAGGGPDVLYCPMVKRSWLQPAESGVGNPYHGKKMLRCGEVVSSEAVR